MSVRVFRDGFARSLPPPRQYLAADSRGSRRSTVFIGRYADPLARRAEPGVRPGGINSKFSLWKRPAWIRWRSRRSSETRTWVANPTRQHRVCEYARCPVCRHSKLRKADRVTPADPMTRVATVRRRLVRPGSTQVHGQGRDCSGDGQSLP